MLGAVAKSKELRKDTLKPGTSRGSPERPVLRDLNLAGKYSLGVY